MYTLSGKNLEAHYSPEALDLSVTSGGKTWKWKPDKIGVQCKNRFIELSSAECVSSAFATGVSKGVKATYRNFPGADFTVHTSVTLNNTDGVLSFELYTENDQVGEIEKLFWPAAFDFNLPLCQGYTIIPQRQGVLIPARWDKPIRHINDGKLNGFDAYMAFFGQVDNGNGYCAIYRTPFDAGYNADHTPGGETAIRPYWLPSLGTISDKRVISFHFACGCDYNDLCKIYRAYLKERGKLVTLKEKIIRNPNVAKLIGTPVVHESIAVHISPDSNYYTPDKPEKNDYHYTFDSRCELLKKLKEKGVDRAYLHYDGWGAHGYDNQHPDPFPVHEAAGGAEGMKRLADTAKSLGYIFGIHDQYRDYYYDGDSFSLDNAVQNADGGHPYCSIWYGGKHSYLCAALAPDYVRRNYAHFEELGIGVEGSYLDVFSIVEMDECFNPEHRMTREQCAAYRRECLDHLTYRGIIPSSEEVTDAIVPSLALCHHAPFATTDIDNGAAEANGVSIPLFNIVHHDCIVVPWFGVNGEPGGWGIPGNDYAFLWGLLCGGTTYYGPWNYVDETTENIRRGKITLNFHERVALCEMIRHDFVENDYRRQRAVYSDGSVVEINMDTQSFRIGTEDAPGEWQHM